MNPDIIIKNPDKTSEIAIKEDKNGLKLKYSISLAGGSGNFEKP